MDPSETTFSLSANCKSTNPNSPNCAKPTPASQAALGGKRMTIAARDATKPFPNKKASKRSSTSAVCSNKTSILKNIPRETKKKLTKTSLRGRISPIARCLKSVSATIMPPKNAPRARESPLREVR